MTTGELIRQARMSAGLTQKELGNRSGIAEPTIGRYELGKLNPKPATLKKIAAALGVEWYELLSDNPDEQITIVNKEVARCEALFDKAIDKALVETPEKEKALAWFQTIPVDWRKDLAVQCQLEILKARYGKDYSLAVFKNLLQLYQDNGDDIADLIAQLQLLALNPPTSAVPLSPPKRTDNK